MSLYSERRSVSLATCVIAILFPAIVWWLGLATDSLVFAWTCALVTATAVGIYTFRRASELVSVSDDNFAVGKAHLERHWIGQVEAFAGEAWQAAVRESGAHRVWLSLRSFHPGGVRVVNTDPADPIKFWLVSSRDPMALAQALGQTGSGPTTSVDRTSLNG